MAGEESRAAAEEVPRHSRSPSEPAYEEAALILNRQRTGKKLLGFCRLTGHARTYGANKENDAAGNNAPDRPEPHCCPTRPSASVTSS